MQWKEKENTPKPAYASSTHTPCHPEHQKKNKHSWNCASFFFVTCSSWIRKSTSNVQTSKWFHQTSVFEKEKGMGKHNLLKAAFRRYTPSVHHRPMHLCNCCVAQIPGLVASSKGQHKGKKTVLDEKKTGRRNKKDAVKSSVVEWEKREETQCQGVEYTGVEIGPQGKWMRNRLEEII